MTNTQKSINARATAVLIELEGGRRFCCGCSKLKPAETFRKLRTQRSAIMRCSECAERHAKGLRSQALVSLLLLAAWPCAFAADLHVVRSDHIDSFYGCTTTRFYIHDNAGQLAMYCPNPPIVRKNPDAQGKPPNSIVWDWYVSGGPSVYMGEGCALRLHFQNAYSVEITQLECLP